MTKMKKYSTLFLLSALTGMMYLTPFLRYSFYDQMIDALGITDAQMGVIGSFYGIFTLFLYVVGGVITERFGAKRMVVFSGFGMTLVTIWYAMFPGFLAVCLIHGFFGVFSVGTYWSAYIQSIRKLGPPKEQGRLYGSSEGIRGLMQAIVSFACLGIVNTYTANGFGFRIMLVINAALFLVMTIACVFILPKDERPAKADVKKEEPKEGLIKRSIVFLKNPGFWICTMAILCTYTIWGTANSYLGTFGTRVLNLSDGLSSTLSIVRSNLIVIVAGIFGGILIDKFRTKARGILLFYGIVIVTTLAIMFTFNSPIVCVALTIILVFAINVLKATYWSIQDDAGLPREGGELATGLISTLAYTPEIYIYFIVPQFLGYGESAGNPAAGFNIMFIWILAFAAIGCVVAVFLEKRTRAIRFCDQEIQKEDEKEEKAERAVCS